MFRLIVGAQIEHARISTRCVSRAVQRGARAGLDGDYSAHSPRVGPATSAHAHGASVPEIQAHGRWQDPRSVMRYVQLRHVPARRSIVEGIL